MDSKFTHLHVHSHYSLLDGLPKIDDLLNYTKELKMDSLALTDHGVLYGAVEFCKKAKNYGVKPIIGSELYVAKGSMADKRSRIDDRIYHLILLVKNEIGYRNLVKLITKAHLEGFYYKPRVDEELLAKHAEGLIALSACIKGKVPNFIIANKIEEAESMALKYRQIFGPDNFYLELQDHPNLPEQQKANHGLLELADKLKIPLVATNDCHYLRPEDAEVQDILMLINTGAKADDPERLTMKNNDYSLRPPQPMIDFCSKLGVLEAARNTQEIASRCQFEFKLGQTRLPAFQTPDNKPTDDYLKELCLAGLESPKKKIADQKLALERLDYELSVIKQTGFAPYFLMVQDFVRWAKDNRIVVGPGRGSAGGSLVAYLTDITEVNPLEYNLLFERFLNPARISMPDIDMDFTDRRRDEVISYVSRKYGQSRVAQIITFGTMAARAAIRDVGRALGVSYGFCDQVAKMIPFGMNLNEALDKVDELRQLYKTDENASKLINLARKLEGVARHASTHACGVIISDQSLDEIVPLQHPTQNDAAIVTQYEMHSIEDLGLLKMDFLGLKNLTIIEDTLARVYKVRNEQIDLSQIPFDDKAAYEIFQQGKTTGVFQVECLAGETIVSNTTIQKLYQDRNKKVLESVYLDEGKVHKNIIENIIFSGVKEVYTLIAENNWSIKATQNHSFLTKDGWKKLSEINPGDYLLMKIRARHSVYNTCQTCCREISGQREGRSNYCYSCSAKHYRNPSKAESRSAIQAAQIKYYQDGGKPWNLGLNVNNSAKVAQIGRSIAKSLAGRSLEDLYGPERAAQFKDMMSKKFSGSGNPMFGKKTPHRKGGYRTDLGHYVRSSWEADFARILRLHKLDYQYECQTFALTTEDGKILHYTPDFYVPSQNTYYEVKGWMHDLDQRKINLFKKQYPQYHFVLVNTTKFAEFALMYKSLVKWECPRIPAERSFEFKKVKEIKYFGKIDTYDIIMRAPGNNFVANGFVVHNSDGMKKYLKELVPTVFEDIVAMIALYRPGPIQFIPDYIERKHNRQQLTYLHPNLEPILKNTQGICVYQEQLMQIARDIAGFSLAEADILRKAVGKKIPELLKAQKEKFVEGAINNKVSKKVAEELWEWVLPFAAYGFNKSHSVAYGIIAYQTAYLKAHYPEEFMSALLTSEKADIERIAFLIDECKSMGIEVLPPDINESFRNFSVVPGEHKIRFGLLAIKNVGENIVEAVLEERKNNGPYQSFSDFVARIDTKNFNKKSLESLTRSGVFDQFEERNQILENMDAILSFNRDLRKEKASSQMSLFGAITSSAAPVLQLQTVAPAKMEQKLLWEKELLGLYVSAHPLQHLTAILQSRAMPIKELRDNFFSHAVRIGGVISSIKKIITKKGQPMLFMKVEDLTDKAEIVVFPSILELKPEIFQENKIVFITGRLDSRKEEIPTIICQDIEEIVEA